MITYYSSLFCKDKFYYKGNKITTEESPTAKLKRVDCCRKTAGKKIDGEEA
jgi:hypothetical protein